MSTATDETKLASTEETERAAAKLAVFRVKTADRAPACATGNDRARSSDRRASGQRHGCGFIAEVETPSPNRHGVLSTAGLPIPGPCALAPAGQVAAVEAPRQNPRTIGPKRQESKGYYYQSLWHSVTQ